MTVKVLSPRQGVWLTRNAVNSVCCLGKDSREPQFQSNRLGLTSQFWRQHPTLPQSSAWKELAVKDLAFSSTRIPKSTSNHRKKHVIQGHTTGGGLRTGNGGLSHTERCQRVVHKRGTNPTPQGLALRLGHCPSDPPSQCPDTDSRNRQSKRQSLELPLHYLRWG